VAAARFLKDSATSWTDHSVAPKSPGPPGSCGKVLLGWACAPGESGGSRSFRQTVRMDSFVIRRWLGDSGAIRRGRLYYNQRRRRESAHTCTANLRESK